MMRKKRASQRLNGLEVQNIVDYYRKGGDMTTTALAERFFVSAQTIRNVCKRAGVRYPGQRLETTTKEM